MQLIKKSFFLFIFFSCLFGVSYIMPIIGSINASILVSLIGIIVYCKDRHLSLFLKKDETIWLSFFILIFIIGVTTVYNQQLDLYFFKEIILTGLARFFASYIIIRLFQRLFGKEACLQTFINIYTGLIIFQIIISIGMFFSPSIYNIISKIIGISSLNASKMGGMIGIRPFGIGSYSFFGAGIINSFVLVLITVFMYNNQRTIDRQKLLYIFLFISVFGLLIARTTIVGTLISICIMTIYELKAKIYILKKILPIVLTTILVISVVPLPSSISSKIEFLEKFGFELFFNYGESGQLTTSSTNSMMKMYVLPDNTKTWIIGDGKWRNGNLYYKETDIGFIRIIYYGGIIGLLAFLIYQMILIKLSSEIFHNLKQKRGYIISFLLLIVLLSLKGFTDLSFSFLCIYNIHRQNCYAERFSPNLSNCPGL